MLSKTCSRINSEQPRRSQIIATYTKSTFLALALLSMAMSPVFGQSGESENSESGEEMILEEVITTGTRRKARSPSVLLLPTRFWTRAAAI